MSHFDVDVNETNVNAIHDFQALCTQQDEDIIFKNEVANDASDCEDDQTNTTEEDNNIFVNNKIANDAVDCEDDRTNTIEEDDNIFVNYEVANDDVDSDIDLTYTKEEDDDVFINNTVANDAFVSGNDRTNSILQNDLTGVPIVYTTRLDEMNIFDKIEKYTPKEAAVLIQCESKPQYQQILPVKREPCGLHSYTFMKLYSDIERLNQKVQTETKLRNEELMGMCKPLKVILKDIKYDKAKTTESRSNNFNQTNRKPERSTPSIKKTQAKPKMTEKGLIKSIAKFQKLMSIKINDSDDSDSLDDMPLTMLKPCVINSIQIVPGSTTLAFINKISMKVDIYIVNNSKILVCSYETDSENFYLMKKTSRSENTVVYDICCWVKREKQIKLLSQCDIANENAISFMRIPHGCFPASCTCCCILEPPMPMQSSVTFLKVSNNKSETKYTEASTLIQKANSCRTKLQSPNICAVDEPISFLKSAVIVMKYKELIFTQSYDLGENYEIGMEGDIDNHVKLSVNRSIIEERELYEKHDRENKICRQYFSYLICCWYKREEIIVNISEAHNLSPRACKYLRNPHLCKSHKCQCCCKRAKIGLLLDDNNIATLPQSKKPSKIIREDKIKNQVVIDKIQATKIKKVYIDNKKYKSKTLAAGNTVAIEGKNKNKPNSVPEMVRHRKPRTVKTIGQTVVRPTIELHPTVTKTVEPPTAPAELITSIFDKLRELKLSVNANGTLTANINTPPEKLLPVEIKVIADLLAQASKQMHELRIEPEEFCRRVNSNSLLINAAPFMGLPNILPPKLQFITQPSSLLPQESFSPPPLCPIVKKTIENTKEIIQPPQPSKVVEQKSQPCKTSKININFPRTTNSSKVANLYSTMSHTGWIRNKCMIAAYNIHFDLEMEEEPEIQLRKTQLTNIEEQQLPKIVNVQSLVDTAPNTSVKSNRSKGKEKQADKSESKGENCKIRVLPPERISALPINGLPISTQMNMISLANLATVTNNFVMPIEPMSGHSQGNLYNSSINRIQNVNGELVSPLPNAGNNVVLAQGLNFGAPMIQVPDSGKIWAFMDGKLVELQCVAPNAMIQNNIDNTFNQNYGIPKTGTINQTPMITVSNGIPMQVSRLCADTELKKDVQAPTVNVETQESAMNALLRDMLSKESSLPNFSPPTPKHRYANALKRLVTPLILEHSKELKLKKRKVLEDPIVPNTASKENLQNAVTDVSIQVIDSDEEEESIFGV